MIIGAKERGYTDVVVINEDRRTPSKSIRKIRNNNHNKLLMYVSHFKKMEC